MKGAPAQLKGGMEGYSGLSSPGPASHRLCLQPSVPVIPGVGVGWGGKGAGTQDRAWCFRSPRETEALASSPMGCPREVGSGQALGRQGAPLLTALLG